MAKENDLKILYDKYLVQFSDKEIVLGSGNVESNILLIGEAPGKDEVRLSRPFVGKAGGYLDEFLEHLGAGRDSIYITNAIKYRLSKIDDKTGRISNRPAKRDEITGSREYLLKEIDIIKPKYIVTLGNVPLKSVTGSWGSNIGGVHGKIASILIMEKEYNLFPLYHPASIIYNRSLKDIYINDMKFFKNVLSSSKHEY